MSVYVVLPREDDLLEQAADVLLAALPIDQDHPAYTERQLEHQGLTLRVPVEDIGEMEVAEPQSLRDELRFLASVTELSPAERWCFKLWADGWSQREIAEKLRASQTYVGQRLRSALLSCYDATPLSFRHFCRHSVYRPPSSSRSGSVLRVCERCGEEFSGRAGSGRFCGSFCRRAARRLLVENRCQQNMKK